MKPRHGGPISRRDVIRLLGAASMLALPAGCSDSEALGPLAPPFFTADERAALGALANAVLPPDDTPGGADLGAVPYIERLLTAFDAETPAIFAGGPYSGRQPYSDGAGGASTSFPPDDFSAFLPLDRVNEAAARLWLFGSKGVPGGGPNDAVLGPIIGLRDQVLAAIHAAMDLSDAPLATLDAPSLKQVFDGLDPDAQTVLIELTCEAAFSAPEYGGNTDLSGWKLVNFEGDSQPLGYSVFDESTGTYRERPDAPVSTANPGADPMPMDAATEDLLKTAALFEGGKVFD